jgi:hypothetical protein
MSKDSLQSGAFKRIFARSSLSNTLASRRGGRSARVTRNANAANVFLNSHIWLTCSTPTPLYPLLLGGHLSAHFLSPHPHTVHATHRCWSPLGG